jgi:hypothetical protein
MRTIRDEDDGDNDVVLEDVFAKGASEKALLCVIDGDEHWIPKSQISDDSEVYDRGHKGKLVITHWLAKQRELV